MPLKNVELLLTENVESLGIVGDVVRVKTGYARNYLLPLGLATIPTERAKQALAERRAQVQRELEAMRKDMEALIEKLESAEVTLEVSCNDHGFLYGSVTQHDIAEALNEAGFPQVRERHVRLGTSIKRIDTYMVPVQLDHDLRTEVKVWVVADRELVFETEEGATGAEGEGETAAGEGEGATEEATQVEATADTSSDSTAEKESAPA